MLYSLLDQHPNVRMLNEFGAFFDLGSSKWHYARLTLLRCWRSRNRPFSGPTRPPHRGHREPNSPRLALPTGLLGNFGLVGRFLVAILLQAPARIDSQAASGALRRLYPGARLIGDKHPDYVFRLDQLAQQPGLRCIAVYRDPRDVASSSREAYWAHWGPWWHADLAHPAGIARRWLQAVDQIERCQDRIHVVRYEQLVQSPRSELDRLASWLRLDPAGLHAEWVHNSSVGKYKESLTRAEREDVIRVAGRAMARLGYD